MAYSINRQPLLKRISDSELEEDQETEIDDPRISNQDEEPFIKIYEPADKYVKSKNVFINKNV